MTLARVIGTVASTIKNEHYHGRKILIVKPVSPGGGVTGSSFLAVDSVSAGIGDLVLVIDEGGSARAMLEDDNCITIRTVIGAIVDEVTREI